MKNRDNDVDDDFSKYEKTKFKSEKELDIYLNEILLNQNYEPIYIKNNDDILRNLRIQLEKLNNYTFSDDEFKKILIYLDSGSTFEKAKKLRDYYSIEKDGEFIFIKFLDQENWDNNFFQIAHQIPVEGKNLYRFDTTIFINGIPVVQIELKRRVVELKEAFNQVKRYKRDALSGLFNYIQIFIISNGVNTKYFANNNSSELNYKSTIYWSTKDNNIITNLHEFTNTFLEKSNVFKMISKYMVLQESTKTLMVLRPYQINAIETIFQSVKNKENGYVKHPVGSGKTITSIKTSQLLTKLDDVYKVVFVVDNKDIDFQNAQEFNHIQPGSINEKGSVQNLIQNLTRKGSEKLVLTTIQKLFIAMNSINNTKLEQIRDENIIFIFDECQTIHFGKMYNIISRFFTNSLYYCFTGTPVSEGNFQDDWTTKSLFNKKLHQYLIEDAIREGYLLSFKFDYCGFENDYPENDHQETLFDSERIENVVNYILKSFYYKTNYKKFNSIFAVSSIELLNEYYELFKKKDHDLKVVAIYSNRSNKNFMDNETSSNDYLDSYINDYNKLFGTKFSSNELQFYYEDVSKRMKDREIDLLLVVDMFLTGFNSKILNTLYLDKSLKYPKLLIAISRTNRVYTRAKTCGNIVSFRNIRGEVIKSLELFSDDTEDILLPSYTELIYDFNSKYRELRNSVGSVEDINEIQTMKGKINFINRFRDLAEVKNKLNMFEEFDFNDLLMSKKEYYDYQSKYLDLYNFSRIKFNQIDESSNNSADLKLNDIDFDLELIRDNYFDVDYILKEIEDSIVSNSFESDKKRILNLVDQNEQLSNKKDLFSKFLDQINKENVLSISEAFKLFMEKEKESELDKLIEDECLNEEKLYDIYQKFVYSNKIYDEEIINSFNQDVNFLETFEKTERIKRKLIKLYERFSFLEEESN